MKNNFVLGEQFRTNCDLIFKDFSIPSGTVFEIIEKVCDGDYKVYFHCKADMEHEECIQIMDIYEINDIQMSTTA